MDLISGGSLWQKQNKNKKEFAPLRENISCDVLIVGGGIIGALMAYELSKEIHQSQKKLSVVLVDKHETGSGSTSASTALLIYSLDVSLTDLTKLIGEEKAVRVYKLSRGSVTEIRRIIDDLGADCGYQDKKTLYLAGEKADEELLKKEYEVLKKNGFKVDYLNKKELQEKFSVEREGGIIGYDQGEVDPYKLTQALVAAAHAAGVRIYEHTEISVKNKNDQRTCQKEILTTDGFSIKTCDLVYATGYESQQYLDEEVVDLKSSYVIAGSPSPALAGHWLKDYLVWETSRPYLYIRSTSDGRVIVGGEDEEVLDGDARDKLISEKSKQLQNKFETLLPDFPITPEYAWAGTFGETKDGLGYVGIPPEFKNIYFILGFGGNGITSGVIAARMLSEMLRGQEPENQDLFSFERIEKRKGNS